MPSKRIGGMICPEVDYERAPADDCVLVLDDPPELADPAVYSQEAQLAAGRVPTWDSQDIQFPIQESGGTVTVDIRNVSSDTAAANVDVRLEASEWGIGFERQDVGTERIPSLLPGETRTLQFERPGDTGAFFATITFTSDRNLLNNYGEAAPQFLDVVPSPTVTPFIQVPIRNDSTEPRQFTITGYESSDHVSLDLGVDQLELDPEEVIDLTATFQLDSETPPDTGHPVTIMAESDTGELAGGVTVVVRAGGDDV